MRIEGSSDFGRSEIDDPRVVIRERVTLRFRKDRLNINFYACSHIYFSARNSFDPACVLLFEAGARFRCSLQKVSIAGRKIDLQPGKSIARVN